jgi:hypothetical protein
MCFAYGPGLVCFITSKCLQCYLLKEHQGISDTLPVEVSSCPGKAHCFTISLCRTRKGSETNQCYLLSSPYFLSPSGFSSLILCTRHAPPSYATTVFPYSSTLKMEAGGLLKSWHLWTKLHPCFTARVMIPGKSCRILCVKRGDFRSVKLNS